MGSAAEAQAAIAGMNGQQHGGRALVVNEARPMEPAAVAAAASAAVVAAASAAAAVVAASAAAVAKAAVAAATAVAAAATVTDPRRIRAS